MKNTNNFMKYNIKQGYLYVCFVDTSVYDILLRDKRNTPTKSNYFKYLDQRPYDKTLYVLS